MAIKLIQDDERLLFVFSEDPEVTITYKRIPNPVIHKLIRECTDKKDKANTYLLGVKALKYAILDWTGINDGNKPAKWDPQNMELMGEYIDRLPNGVVNEFTEKLLTGLQSEEAAKNSRTARSSG